MGESASRAMMFAVGLFITLMIASGVIFIFSQMQEIYREVDSTDTNITSRFGKYAMYDNTEVTGLDVINCANKYYDDNFVVVSYMENDVNNSSGIEFINQQLENGNLKYEDKFIAITEEAEYDGVIKQKITFTKI